MNKILLTILTILTFNIIQPAQDQTQQVQEAAIINSMCAICQDNMLPVSTITNLQCNHTFHSECINTWLADHTTCPICRADNGRAMQDNQILEALNILQQRQTLETAETIRRLTLQLQNHINTEQFRIERLEQRLIAIQERQYQFSYFKNMAIAISASFVAGIISSSTIRNIMAYGINAGTSTIQNYFTSNSTR